MKSTQPFHGGYTELLLTVQDGEPQSGSTAMMGGQGPTCKMFVPSGSPSNNHLNRHKSVPSVEYQTNIRNLRQKEVRREPSEVRQLQGPAKERTTKQNDGTPLGSKAPGSLEFLKSLGQFSPEDVPERRKHNN